MFDVGFSELGVIGLVALIVIGPEQLPRVARTAGHLMGRLRRYVSDVKSDITREMELADLQRIHEEVQDSARSLVASVSEQVAGIESDVQQAMGVSEAHQLADTSVAEAVPATSDLFEFESAPGLEVPPAEAVVDPNQMDLFGTPAKPRELPEKH
ncbi:MAG: Sec-independent protein translocase subunit [Rhodocyclales bacterium]|nr:Sec-independent protein translocase subunit [Rhodocyclales bacterium]